MSASKPVVVFVHGSWHSPKHFEPVRKVFEAKGLLDTECPLQPSFDNLTLTDPMHDDAKTIHDAVLKLVEQGRDVIVVMHSYGGIVGSEAITKDLGKEERQTKGLSGGVTHLLYLCAFIAPVGVSLGGIFGGNLPPYISLHEDGSCTMDEPELRFYNDLSKEDQAKWVKEVRPQLTKAQMTPIKHAAYQHYPTTYLLCENDQALPVEVQKMMVEKAPNCETVTCSAGHSPFLSQPKVVLKVVEDMINGGIGAFES